MLEQGAKNRKRLYCLVAITLAICLSVTAFLSLQLISNRSVQTLDSNMQQQASVQPNSTLTTSNQTSDTNSSTYSNDSTPTPNSQGNSSFITEQQALDIAMPIIQQYAAENNRTILAVNASFDAHAVILGGPRGPSLADLNTPNLQWSSYPSWFVGASFEPLNNMGDILINGTTTNTNPQCWITGYEIWIYADNGQVADSHPDGIM